MKKKKKKRADVYNILLVLMFLVGIGMLLYPSLGDYYNSFHQSYAISNYVKNVEEMDDTEYQAMLQAARDFNENVIYPKGGFSFLTAEERKIYNSLLNITDDGMMGYVDIPTIKTSLAVYHTTEEKFLQIGAGHLEQTSLPIGGENTHSALSGHRGLVSAKLFTNLNELVEGDIFTLHIMDEVLTYRVESKDVVLPDRTEGLKIEEGGDLCTLITCTPYGINSYRLLVKGRRIENLEDTAKRIPSDAIEINHTLIAIVMAVPVLVLLMVWVVARRFV